MLMEIDYEFTGEITLALREYLRECDLGGAQITMSAYFRAGTKFDAIKICMPKNAFVVDAHFMVHVHADNEFYYGSYVASRPIGVIRSTTYSIRDPECFPSIYRDIASFYSDCYKVQTMLANNTPSAEVVVEIASIQKPVNQWKKWMGSGGK